MAKTTKSRRKVREVLQENNTVMAPKVVEAPKVLTALQQFQKLDIEVRRKAVKYYREQHGTSHLLSPQYTTLSDAIMHISWSNTQEGDEYWLKIHINTAANGD